MGEWPYIDFYETASKSTVEIIMFPNKTKRDIRPRLFLYGEKFPEKLYSVVQDGFLLSWDEAGEKINIGDPPATHSLGKWKSDGPERFENLVMDLYPGFVQIPQFANLRRLFREYSFNWHLSASGHFTFSHPCFLRGRTDLLSKIKTRRKSLPLYGFRRNTRRRNLLRSPRRLKKDDPDADEGCIYDDIKADNSSDSLKKTRQSFRKDILTNNESKRSPSPCRVMDKDQLKNIFQSFVKNELEHDKILQVDWSSSSKTGIYEDNLAYNNFSLICLSEEENLNENIEDHVVIENGNSDSLFEWIIGPHGYLRPVLNSEGVITRTYYPL